MIKRCFSVFLCLTLLGCQTTSNQLVDQTYFVLNQPRLFAHVNFLADDLRLGRAANSQGNSASAHYIANNLQTMNINPLPELNHYFSPFSYKKNFSEFIGNNVIGFKKGVTDKFIVLSAHFDHIGHKGERIFNGADDNASGVAALLEIADALNEHKTRHNIIYLFTDGEELNLKGAKAFARQFPAVMDNTILNVNLDMLAGTQSTRRLHLFSYRLNHLLDEALTNKFEIQQQQSAIKIRKGFRQSKRNLTRIRNWYLASDHGVFYRKKIPFIYYGVGEHANYHKTTDTYENINKHFLWLASNTIFQHLLFLDKHIQLNS